MSPVRIIETSYVSAPATIALPPGAIKFNAMEALWVTFPLLQHVLLFDDLESADVPQFDTIVESLRSSLAATLDSFAPLAGKLVHLKDTGDVGISCSDSDGVMFVVAESDAEIRRLAGDEQHDMSVLERLVPTVEMNKLPTPVLAVQATRFEGGVAVGLTAHHGVMDGRSLWTFVEAWAASCRGETPVMVPSFDRSLVNLPGGHELASSVLRKFAPNLPSAPAWSMVEDHRQFSRRTLALDARQIERLKRRIVHLGQSLGAPLSRPPSTFAAVVALAWTCCARCKPFAADDELMLFFLADARDGFDPPVAPAYMGACLAGCLARLHARELRGEHALAAAASAIQDEVRKMRMDPLARWDFLTPMMTVDVAHVMNVSGSPSFRAYDVADFGWGKPRRTENIRMNQDGQVALMRARDGHGVQVSISLLQATHMDEFKSEFIKLQE